MTDDLSDRPIAWVVDREGETTTVLRSDWTWLFHYDEVSEETRRRAVALIPITRLEEAEERHNRQAAELRDARDAALSEVERLTAFKDATPQITVDYTRGPVPYIEIVGAAVLVAGVHGGLRGWLHPTSDQISREMGDALATVFGSRREPFSVITPRMVSEQLIHVRDQRPVEVHHHDIEKHAESYMEGYDAAERQATEPIAGYDEPDAANPAHLRFAADVLEAAKDLDTSHSDRTGHPKSIFWTADELRRVADGIENAQARSERVEDLAADLFGHMPRAGAGGCSRDRRYDLAAFLVDLGYGKGRS